MLTSAIQKFSPFAILRKALGEISSRCLENRVVPKLSAIRFLSSIRHDNVGGKIEIDWNDGDRCCVPYEFLRDNCQCPSCFYEPATQSLTLLPDVLKEAGQGVQQANFEGGQIVIHWNSGHLSRFKSAWLRERVFSQQQRANVRDLKYVLWGSEHKKNLKFFNFDQIIKNDNHLLEWMTVLATEGINVVEGAPKKPDQLRVLAKKAFGSLYNTMYG